jgi:hypothetical protein
MRNTYDEFYTLIFLNDIDAYLITLCGGIIGVILFEIFFYLGFATVLKVKKIIDSIIPTTLIMNNETMMMHIFGEKRVEEKKRRAEKRRRARLGGR